MKRVVLIDGENFVYGLRTLLGDEEKAPRSAINNLNMRALLDELLADNPATTFLWFGARLKIYDQTAELLEKSQTAVRTQSAFVNRIQQQKIQYKSWIFACP